MPNDKLYNLVFAILSGTLPRRGKIKRGPLSTSQLAVEAVAHRVLDKRLPHRDQLILVRKACTQLQHRGLINSWKGKLPEENSYREFFWELAVQKASPPKKSRTKRASPKAPATRTKRRPAK